MYGCESILYLSDNASVVLPGLVSKSADNIAGLFFACHGVYNVQIQTRLSGFYNAVRFRLERSMGYV